MTKYSVCRDIFTILFSEGYARNFNYFQSRGKHGGTVRAEFYELVAQKLDIPVVINQKGNVSKVETARNIIVYSNEPWTSNMASEGSPSGGGGTVTLVCLKQIRKIVRQAAISRIY